MIDTLVRVLIASVVLGGLAWGVATAIGYASPGRAMVATVAALVVGGLGFLVALRLLQVRELGLLRDAVRRRPLKAADEPA
jgi:hypothetical protein